MPGPLCLAPTPSGEGSSSGGCTSLGFLPGQPLLPCCEWENWEQGDGQGAVEIPAEADAPAAYLCVCDGNSRARNHRATREAAPRAGNAK